MSRDTYIERTCAVVARQHEAQFDAHSRRQGRRIRRERMRRDRTIHRIMHATVEKLLREVQSLGGSRAEQERAQRMEPACAPQGGNGAAHVARREVRLKRRQGHRCIALQEELAQHSRDVCAPSIARAQDMQEHLLGAPRKRRVQVAHHGIVQRHVRRIVPRKALVQQGLDRWRQCVPQPRGRQRQQGWLGRAWRPVREQSEYEMRV